jgi:hypothetical protein
MITDDRCPKCGALLFTAIPGKTTEAEILAFLKGTRPEQTAEEQSDPWIHPGTYCPSGCEGVGCLAEYGFPRLIDDNIYTLALVSPGARPQHFVVRLRQVLGCSPKEARDLTSRAGAVLLTGEAFRVHAFLERFQDLDAKWDITPPPPKGPSIGELLSAYYKPEKWPWLRQLMHRR